MASLESTFNNGEAGTITVATSVNYGTEMFAVASNPQIAVAPAGYADSGGWAARVSSPTSTTTTRHFSWAYGPVATQARQCFRFYYLRAGSSQVRTIFRMGAGTTTAVALSQATNGVINVLNASQATVHSSPAISSDTWYRIEGALVRGTTTSNGSFQFRMYTMAGTLFDSADLTGQNFRTDDAARIYIWAGWLLVTPAQWTSTSTMFGGMTSTLPQEHLSGHTCPHRLSPMSI